MIDNAGCAHEPLEKRLRKIEGNTGSSAMPKLNPAFALTAAVARSIPEWGPLIRTLDLDGQ